MHLLFVFFILLESIQTHGVTFQEMHLDDGMHITKTPKENCDADDAIIVYRVPVYSTRLRFRMLGNPNRADAAS